MSLIRSRFTSEASQTGATLVLVAVALLMLMGFVALAIDGGLGYDTRRGSQNAADNAALAAAWEACNPSTPPTSPEAEAAATTQAYGYDDADDNVTVATDDLGGGMWQVTITVVNDGVFGPATPYAGNSLTVVSEATASCEQTQFLGGNALFAGAQACHPVTELNMSGSSIEVSGGIFSNGSLTIHSSAPGPTLSGPNLYGDPNNSNTGSQYTGPLPVDYPVDFSIYDYRPGGSRATGNYISTNQTINNNWMTPTYADDVGGNAIRITQSGVYYTSRSISLHNVTAAPGVQVTFVAEGTIDLNGSNLNDLNGYSPVVAGGNVGLLMFSDYGSAAAHENPPSGSCSGQDGIKISSATFSNMRGLIFAPHSSIQFSSSNVDLNGSIIGYMVKTSGSSIDVTYTNDPAFVPDYIVELVR